MNFYGLVGPRDNVYRPSVKTESLEYAREIKGDRCNFAIIKYKGYKRTAHGRTTLVIQDIEHKQK